MVRKIPNPTSKDQIQRKRTASENPIDERVCKYLKSVGNTDCLSIDPLDAASEQGDTGLVPQKPSKAADRPCVNAGLLTEQAIRLLNSSNRPCLSRASPSMSLGTHSESGRKDWLSDETEDAINADDPSYSGGLE